jgi:ribonucleoside-triphosphate reductase
MPPSAFKNPTQELQFLDKYSRWNDKEKRRETWPETVERVVTFFKKHTEYEGVKLSEIPWDDLEGAMLNMEAMPSMRVVQMAGPALERCNVGAYNCAYLPLDSFSAFGELLYILMQGTGCGFSVEQKYVSKLPAIEDQNGELKVPFLVEDTTEGWCNALLHGMETWAEGYDVEFDYTQIRPQGAVLRTKGGRASGPEPLRQLLLFVRKRMLQREGSYLTPLDAHDIACMCGSIVQVGGVRRAAEISLSDINDEELRYAKFGDFGREHPERYMANNSAVYESKPSLRKFTDEWLSLAMSGTGERGIFNREGAKKQMPKRRKRGHRFGLNPCGEIVLRPRQFCNLSIAIARAGDTEATLYRKVRLAAIFGTLQSTLTNFRFINEEWKKNCEEERLLGVDITGQMDCALLQPRHPYRTNLLERLKEEAITTNKKFAQRLGIPESTAVTCVKPSGNSAQLFDCSSGLHPRYAKFYIRRFRIGSYTPIGKFLKEAGVPYAVPHEEDQQNPAVLVFEFPMAAPKGAPTRHDLTAVQQLENWLDWKQHYTEHNPSATIYIDDDAEWLEAGSWVFKHWDQVGGIAFLPRDGGSYLLPPYEEIDSAEFERRNRRMPVLDFSKLAAFETEDTTEVNKEFACTGDRCEL